MDYLCRHLADDIATPDLARRCGLSPSRLMHLFREQTHTTPQQFLETQRMARARQLLDLTARPVYSIAEEVGYASAFYFSSRFRLHTGLSPRAYRQRENTRSNGL